MAGTPLWKVYDAGRQYQAATKQPEQAAAILGGVGGAGWTIRWGHSLIVWTEGPDGDSGESYDAVAEMAHYRVKLKLGDGAFPKP